MSSIRDEERFPGQGLARPEGAQAEDTPVQEKLVMHALAVLCLGTTLAWVTFLGWLCGWLVGLW